MDCSSRKQQCVVLKPQYMVCISQRNEILQDVPDSNDGSQKRIKKRRRLCGDIFTELCPAVAMMFGLF